MMENMKNNGAARNMLAMVLDAPGLALRHARIPTPVPADHELLVKVAACGVCRTDLHIVDGELAPHRSPLVLGHEIVGTVVQLGAHATKFQIGDRIGIPWLGRTCGQCAYCRFGHENLCDAAKFTGYDINGGYAEYAVADARYCFHLPNRYDSPHAAPLLCAGLIGYRAYVMAGEAMRLGLYGFGAAAHILVQVAKHEGKQVYAFTRPGDTESQLFARSMGADWAGGSNERLPVALDAAILFAPVGSLVPLALQATRKGGTVICAGIHMSDIPAFPYSVLWGERTVRSVANLTRRDGENFFALAGRFEIKTSPRVFPLIEASQSLNALRSGKMQGAAVLIP